mmetsp:Transcript_61452/g.97867  ORF Transcript_61452/g.97867 Transcript_61452/m.97867 type:complete len:314 (+) Transcript_61452:2-943(+)
MVLNSRKYQAFSTSRVQPEDDPEIDLLRKGTVQTEGNVHHDGNAQSHTDGYQAAAYEHIASAALPNSSPGAITPGMLSDKQQIDKHVPVQQQQAMTVNKTPLLLNSWRNRGQDYCPFAVHKIGTVVHLQGSLVGGGQDQCICELPEDCWPMGIITTCFDQDGGNYGRLRITSKGQVIPEYISKEWVYLDNVSFVAAVDVVEEEEKNENLAVDMTPELENGWTNIENGYVPFKVFKIGGVVHLQGCVKGGSVNAMVCRLMDGCRPPGIMTFVFDQQGEANGRLRVMKDGAVIPEVVSKQWIYLDGISFVATMSN